MRLPDFNPWSSFEPLFSHTIRCVCIVACIGKAYAQDSLPFSDVSSVSEIPVIESITVTGSLLPKGDFVSNAPITTLSAEMFEMSNATNVETLINSMPQVIGGTIEPPTSALDSLQRNCEASAHSERWYS